MSDPKIDGASIPKMAEKEKKVSDPLSAVWRVLGWAIFSAAGLMAFALFIQSYDSEMVDATKDVLPLATGLVGFAGGAVTAIFGKSIEKEEKK